MVIEIINTIPYCKHRRSRRGGAEVAGAPNIFLQVKSRPPNILLLCRQGMWKSAFKEGGHVCEAIDAGRSANR